MTKIEITHDITVEPVRHLASDDFVAEAARVSTIAEIAAIAAQERSNRGLIRRLIKERHGSPFEHALFTSRVHMPLNVAMEHLRHRTGWSYNGESARYKEMRPVFYVPPRHRPLTQSGKAMDYDLAPGTDAQYESLVEGARFVHELAYGTYLRRLDDGIAREAARGILGTDLMVTYYTSCNPRSLMHFLSLRTEDREAAFPSKPLWEIQQVAAGYEEQLATSMPITHTFFNEFGRVAP